MILDQKKIIEEFRCFLDRIDGQVAHVTLTAKDNEQFWCEMSVKELNDHGIFERRWFRCCFVEDGDDVKMLLEAVPEITISQEREKEINDMLEFLNSDD